jgi:cholesterol transport system auxiliary component
MKRSKLFDSATSSSVLSGWMVRISAIVLLALILTGCLSRAPMNVQTFAFSAPASPVTGQVTAVRVLGIKSLQVAPPFDGRSFVYRTGEYSYERDSYAQFLGDPAEVLAVPVREMLLGDGCFRDVVKAGSAAKPNTLVEINVSQLYGDIRKPGSPCAVLAMQVIFLEATNGLPGKVILQQNYSRRIPMKSTAPAALMAAWNRALVEIFADVASDFRSRENP